MNHSPPRFCWALATTMERITIDGFNTATTIRQLLGYRYAASEDEAIGSFIRKCQQEHPGFKAGQVLTHLIPIVASSPAKELPT